MVDRKIYGATVFLGADPELFFKKDGQIIGAEKVIPKAGLPVAGEGKAQWIIDGVQGELNPHPYTCRANFANGMKKCFQSLESLLNNKNNKGISADFSRLVEISKENLMELEPKHQQFGCMPSLSIYDNSDAVKITEVNPFEYRKRAAGGHIHLGYMDPSGYAYNTRQEAFTTDAKRTVELLDIIVGNTGVLLDRDEANIERRKMYGRAGEYRLPKHGIEYRTLSNFWLTAYPLMSLMFGLARFAVQVAADPKRHDELYKEFTSAVKLKNVQKAINNNDFDLAAENYNAIEPLIVELAYEGDGYPITQKTLEPFAHFVDRIYEKGLGYWFKEEPMYHWTHLAEAHSNGAYDFLLGTVYNDMKRVKAA